MSDRQFFHLDVIDDILVLELCDAISSLADSAILNELEEIRRVRRDIGLTKLIVDLAHAPFFGSSFLELIRVLWNDVAARQGRLVLCNPSPVGREVLEVAKFDRLWPLVDSRADALASLRDSDVIAAWPTPLVELLSRYTTGPELLNQAVEGLSSVQIRRPTAPGTWSVLQVVSHLADFELVYADRMKRVIAEDRPTFFSGDPDRFAARLAYPQRQLTEELTLIGCIRGEMSRILRTLPANDFERIGIHSEAGPLTLVQLLERVAGHVPHHTNFIEQKRNLLLSGRTPADTLRR